MNKALLLIGTVLILAIFLVMSVPYAQSMGGGMMGGGGHGVMGLGYGMGWFGTIIMAAGLGVNLLALVPDLFFDVTGHIR